MSIPKEDLHKLVEQLPESETRIAKNFLKMLIDEANRRVLEAFQNADEDDEPTTNEELELIELAKKDIKEGNLIKLDDLKEEFGL